MTGTTEQGPVEGTTARAGTIALDWWRSNLSLVSGVPGTRARLRRCRDVSEALAIPAAIILARRLGAFRDDERLQRALGLARVLAHVSDHTSELPMRAAGWTSLRAAEKGDERPRLGETRFRRLLLVKGGEEQVAAFSRLVALLDGTANVPALSTAFLWWNDRTRHRWTFDYYAAGVAAPDGTHNLDEDDA